MDKIWIAPIILWLISIAHHVFAGRLSDKAADLLAEQREQNSRVGAALRLRLEAHWLAEYGDIEGAKQALEEGISILETRKKFPQAYIQE